MKVRELIEILQKLPQSLYVVIEMDGVSKYAGHITTSDFEVIIEELKE
jgi:hypothetical protein